MRRDDKLTGSDMNSVDKRNLYKKNTNSARVVDFGSSSVKLRNKKAAKAILQRSTNLSW